jgi:hypothetical protein
MAAAHIEKMYIIVIADSLGLIASFRSTAGGGQLYII